MTDKTMTLGELAAVVETAGDAVSDRYGWLGGRLRATADDLRARGQLQEGAEAERSGARHVLPLGELAAAVDTAAVAVNDTHPGLAGLFEATAVSIRAHQPTPEQDEELT